MRFKIILLLVSLTIFSGLFAQQPQQTVQVKRSTDKVKIEDKYFYIHIVQKGESLYAISKAYGVSQIDIASENPDIILGIQVDQAIKIPAKDLLTKEEDDKFIHHIVKKGETLFGLSRRYKVSIEDIAKVNPEVESGLVLSQILLIPKEKLTADDIIVKKDSLTFIYHQVRQKEGLYSISRFYNISIQEIESYNKEVLSSGLKYGTTLKIPRQTVVNISTPQAQQAIVEKNGAIVEPRIEKSKPAIECDTFVYSNSKQIFNIALLLPILPEEEEQDSLEMIDPITGEALVEKEKEKDRISIKSSNYLDFYQGFLMAVDSLKREGLSMNISIFNTKNSLDEVNKLIKEKAIQEANLIIGPVYPDLLSPMADFSRQNRINIVSPLSPNNTLLKNNPFLFQVNPSYSQLNKEFISGLSFEPNQNLIVVYEDSVNLEMIMEYKELLASKINEDSNSESIHFKVMSYAPGGIATEIKEKLNQSLTDQKENIIFLPSENEAFISDFLSHLFGLTTYYGYKVKVYGFPKLQRFRNIPIEYYYKLNIHLFTPFYVDYSRDNVKKFVYKYRRYYKSEPSQYSFQGNDIGLYFLKAMKKYGLDFKYCLNSLNVELLQSNYQFIQQSDIDGFENKSIFLIHYRSDYEIVREK
ncbi:MAG: LysM peptidoglycan-binding domain-containing protein [Tenuifilaceae bacterium]